MSVMKNSIIFILLSFIIITCFCTCSKSTGDCELVFTVENASGLLFEIKDSTKNKYVFDRFSPVFKVDSFEIRDNQGASHTIFRELAGDITKLEDYYAVETFGIYNPEFDTKLLIDTIKKDLYLIYKKGVIDTISISYKAHSSKCGSEFSFLKVVYKNKIISNTTGEFKPRVHFTRY